MENLAAARIAPNFKAVQTASFGDDSGVHAQFDDEFVRNEYKSDREGRAVYDQFYIIELQWPGDNTKSFKYRFPITETRNEWIERFPKQWEAFKASQEQTPNGTPIELWPPLDKKRVYELKANRIFTIEQIASVKDTDLQVALGLDGRKLRDQAVAFLNPAASAVQVSQLLREIEDLRAKLAVQPQNPEVSHSEAEQPKKRGPKPKLTQAA